MKIEKFLKWITEKMLNYPDIHLITLKMFIDKFYDCLSEKEQIRYYTECLLIKEFTLKQISLDTIVHKNIVKNLDNELNNLKNNKKSNAKQDTNIWS